MRKHFFQGYVFKWKCLQPAFLSHSNNFLYVFVLFFSSIVSPIKKPSGITILRDKLIIADKKNLHLAKTSDDDGVTYIHKLWSLPDDMNSDSIESVSTDPEICVCSTKSGIVFVLDNVLWVRHGTNYWKSNRSS